MSNRLPSPAKEAGDKDRNRHQGGQSINAGSVSRDLRPVLTALISSALISVLFIAGPPLINAQSSSAPPGWTASTTGPIAIYKPENLPPGKAFQLTIRPPQPLAGQPLVAWFTAQVQADLQQRGAQTRIGNPQANPDGSLLLLVPYQDHVSQNWTAVYAVAAGPDGAQFCSMISNLSPQEMKPYIRSGATIFGEALKQARDRQSPPPLKDEGHAGDSASMDPTKG